MSRSLLALFSVSVVVLTTIAAADDTKPGSEFHKEIRVPSNVGFSTDISPDGQAATVLFDNVYVELNAVTHGASGATNQTEIQTKLVTLNIPYSTDQRSVQMTMDVRGYFDTDAGATARLIACTGDATQAIDLTAAKSEEVQLKGKSKELITAEHAEAELGDFQHRVEFTVATHATKPVLQITLFLVVERDTDTADSGSALLAVDSLDLAIAMPGKGKYK